MFFVPYVTAVSVQFALGTMMIHSPGVSRTVAPLVDFTFLPVFHNFAMLTNNGGTEAAAMWVVGFVAGACEIAGLAMLILGEIGHRRPDRAALGPRWTLGGGPAGAEVGASVSTAF